MSKKNPRLEILIKVISLEVNKGHLKWKVSDLARLCDVSRSLVYYHFGKTKQEILSSCLELLATEYYGLNRANADWVFDGSLPEVLLRARKLHMKTPAIAAFYQRWRMQDSPLKDQLEKYEIEFQQKIKKAHPHLSMTKILAIHGIFHGLITAPFITDAAIAEGARLIRYVNKTD